MFLSFSEILINGRISMPPAFPAEATAVTAAGVGERIIHAGWLLIQ